MGAKLIAIEESEGPLRQVLQRVMQIVPERDKGDKKLKRLIAFRLRIDGDKVTSEYLSRKTREAARCAYTGSFYDFIKDDAKQNEFIGRGSDPHPPDVA